MDSNILSLWKSRNHQPSPSSICNVQVVLKCLSHTPGSHSVCVVRSLVRVDQKIVSIRREPMLIDFLTLILTVHVESSGSSYILSGTYRESTHCCYYFVYCYIFYIMLEGHVHYRKGGFPPWFHETQISDASHYSATKNVNTISHAVTSQWVSRKHLR